MPKWKKERIRKYKWIQPVCIKSNTSYCGTQFSPVEGHFVCQKLPEVCNQLCQIDLSLDFPFYQYLSEYSLIKWLNFWNTFKVSKAKKFHKIGNFEIILYLKLYLNNLFSVNFFALKKRYCFNKYVSLSFIVLLTIN